MSRHTLRRPAVALVVAILSVVLVTAGSATAAKLITGKDIKNSSVTGKDLKTNSVGLPDLSAGAKAAMTGPAGASGPAGPAGPAVLTNVYATSLALESLVQDVPEVVLDKILPSPASPTCSPPSSTW